MGAHLARDRRHEQAVLEGVNGRLVVERHAYQRFEASYDICTIFEYLDWIMLRFDVALLLFLLISALAFCIVWRTGHG